MKATMRRVSTPTTLVSLALWSVLGCFATQSTYHDPSTGVGGGVPPPVVADGSRSSLPVVPELTAPLLQTATPSPGFPPPAHYDPMPMRGATSAMPASSSSSSSAMNPINQLRTPAGLTPTLQDRRDTKQVRKNSIVNALAGTAAVKNAEDLDAEDHDLAALVDYYRTALGLDLKKDQVGGSMGSARNEGDGPRRQRAGLRAGRQTGAATQERRGPAASFLNRGNHDHERASLAHAAHYPVLAYGRGAQQSSASGSQQSGALPHESEQCTPLPGDFTFQNAVQGTPDVTLRRRSSDMTMAALRFNLEDATRDAYHGVSERDKLRRIAAFLRNDVVNGKIIATMLSLALGHIVAGLVEPEVVEKPVVGQLVNLGFSIPFYFLVWAANYWNTKKSPKLQLLARKYSDLESKVEELKVVRDNLRKWRNNIEWLARGERYGLYDDGAGELQIEKHMAAALAEINASVPPSLAALYGGPPPPGDHLNTGVQAPQAPAAGQAAVKGFPHRDANGSWFPQEVASKGLDPSRESWFRSLGDHVKTELRMKMRAYRRRVQQALHAQVRLSGEVEEEFYFQLALIDEMRSLAVADYLQEVQTELESEDPDSDDSASQWEQLAPEHEEELGKLLDGCSDRTKLTCLHRYWRKFWACGTAPTKAKDGEHNFYTLQQDLYPIGITPEDEEDDGSPAAAWLCSAGSGGEEEDTGRSSSCKKDDGSQLVWAGEKCPLSVLAKVRAKETLANLDLIEKALTDREPTASP